MLIDVRSRLILSLGVLAAGTAAAQTTGAGFPRTDALEYRYVGPPGNRVTAVAGIPGDPTTYYIGAASGGIFKTTDGGVHWTPLFDREAALSIGALAVEAGNPEVVWAGTGESFVRSNISMGDGVYLSKDAGRTWRHMGLEHTGRIARIIIHPANPDILWVAAMGHGYGPQQDRGVFKTTDGGKTWRRVLFVDENTGASDIAIDPGDPNTLYAGTWQFWIATWALNRTGPGSGLYRSNDGGETWTPVTSPGLPSRPLGKIGLAIAPSRPQRIYALIDTEAHGGLWSSDDGGKTFALTNQSHMLAEAWPYFTRLAVTPDNPDELYIPAPIMTVSRDGGKTVTQSLQADNHDIWIDPKNGGRIIVGNDIGVSITVNRGRSWNTMRLPIAQMYHVSVDDAIPYNLYGTRLDGGSFAGPSDSRLPGGVIHHSAWRHVGGCEGGHTIVDSAARTVWSGCFGGWLERHDVATAQSRRVSPWPYNPMGEPATGLKYRFAWSFPVVISPHDDETVYAGSQYVHRTTNGGQSWDVISPDLTSNDPALKVSTGGVSTVAPALFALAESPIERGQLWAGTNDGRLQLSRDAGGTWTDVTPNLPGLPPRGTISNIEPSPHRAGTCYVSVDLHQVNNRDPYIYRTDDYGKTWRRIVTGIPASVFSFVHVVREDPVRPGLLFAGTDNGLYVSQDGGTRWTLFQNNLPRAPVHWIEVQRRFSDLVVATFGRGFYILDDITPLREWNASVAASEAWLFQPRPAYRFQSKTFVAQPVTDPVNGRSPPEGAAITFHLRETQPVRLTFADSAGTVLRTITDSAEAGWNRVWWDFRLDPTPIPQLKGPPIGHEHLSLGPDSLRTPFPVGNWDSDISPKVPPGSYTVTLIAGDRRAQRTVRVVKDPHTVGTEQDIRLQYAFMLELRRDVTRTARLIEELDRLRYSARGALRRAAERKLSHRTVAAVETFEKDLLALQERIVQLHWADGMWEPVTAPGKLFWNLLNLGGAVDASSDYRPTDQMHAVAGEYRAVLDEVDRRQQALRRGSLRHLDDLRKRVGLPPSTVERWE